MKLWHSRNASANSGSLDSESALSERSWPPGFESLPGCTNGSGGSGGSGGSTSGTGTWTTETIAGMSVRLYTPTTDAALPAGRALMISLHGCVQKASDLQSAGNWAQTADEYGMVVALPDAPNGGVVLGCWDYYDANHSRTAPSRHDDNLLSLPSTFTARTSLGIDYPAYVTEFFFDNNRRVDRSGAPTPTPTATPTPTPTPTDCVTATNAAHKAAGRATSYGINPCNPYYATGTQDCLGLGDATVTSLQKLSATSWDLVSSCG